jgi:long-chain acyl-CoA synthetase
LAQFVNEQVGKTQRPSSYEIIGNLPRSAIGKVLKRELRDNFAERMRAARIDHPNRL